MLRAVVRYCVASDVSVSPRCTVCSANVGAGVGVGGPGVGVGAAVGVGVGAAVGPGVGVGRSVAGRQPATASAATSAAPTMPERRDSERTLVPCGGQRECDASSTGRGALHRHD